MIIKFDANLTELALSMPVPLYAVGGCVRDFLIDGKISSDIDICSTLYPQDFSRIASSLGFNISATYKRTGTVVIEKDNIKYEYSVTRSEEYSSGGEHIPNKVVFGVSVEKDATRRDFKCNAIYYDIKNNKFVDPLNGMADVANKVLSTVIDAQQVFSHDGLRLMRLARFSGELGFSVEAQTLEGAKTYAKNILDISVERISDELKKILQADSKHAYSPKDGHYRALKVLDKTRVLDYILPELTLGRNLVQRSDFHKYDVLEHTLRCVLYANKSIRLSALLHDIGKPERFLATGKYHGHAESGEKIAKGVLKKYRFDNKTIEEVGLLVKTHMLDIDCNMKESKIRKQIVTLGDNLDKALMLKIADCKAGKDLDIIPKSVIKWQEIRKKMLSDNTPFSIKDLNISAQSLMGLGYNGKQLGKQLKKLFDLAVVDPTINTSERLLEISAKAKI